MQKNNITIEQSAFEVIEFMYSLREYNQRKVFTILSDFNDDGYSQQDIEDKLKGTTADKAEGLRLFERLVDDFTDFEAKGEALEIIRHRATQAVQRA